MHIMALYEWRVCVCVYVRTAATGACDLLQMNNYNEIGCMMQDFICAIRFSSNKCASHGQIMSLGGRCFCVHKTTSI